MLFGRQPYGDNRDRRSESETKVKSKTGEDRRRVKAENRRSERMKRNAGPTPTSAKQVSHFKFCIVCSTDNKPCYSWGMDYLNHILYQ
jgi:hypothetical protein